MSALPTPARSVAACADPRRHERREQRAAALPPRRLTTGDSYRRRGAARAGSAATVPRVLEVRDLTKRFGANLAVDGLSFKAEPGRVLGFLGPNGAGKTTTLRMLLGLTLPTSGSTSGRRPALPRS